MITTRSLAAAGAAARLRFALAGVASPAPRRAGQSGTTTMNGYQIETDQTNWNAQHRRLHDAATRCSVTRPGTDARGDHAKGNTSSAPRR